MNPNDFIGHLRYREFQTDIPNSTQANSTESTLSSSSNKNMPLNKIYQEKLNTKTFLSSIWHLRFNKSFLFPHQHFEAIETERRTHLQVKFSLELQHYNNYIKTINKAKFKKQNYIDHIIFQISFQKPTMNSNSNNSSTKSSNTEFQLAQTDNFNINITIYNEQLKIEKQTFTSNLDFLSSSRTDLSNVVSFLNANNNDNINLLIYITIEIIPKRKYEQKYIGLINKGNTCYLNSIIQMFYMIPLFAKEIKQNTFSSNSTLQSLKRLFIAMDEGIRCNSASHSAQSEDDVIKRVSPEEFIHSLELFSGKSMRLPNDIQEFFMILGDVLGKETSKDSQHMNVYNMLFEGKILTTIYCKYVTYSSVKEESFNDIQLVVKECKSIEESFDNFTSDEELFGNNQYQTDLFGKQDAIKRTVFSSLPKVLLIQLKRFEYNVEHNQMDKVYSSFTFEQKLNLKKYIDGSIYKDNTNYICRGVIVHSGSIDNGHYYTFIKDKNEEWFKFNDSIVEHAYEYEVYDNNYGGELYYYSYSAEKGGIARTVKGQNTSAYVLMYVREDCLKEIYFCNDNNNNNTSNSSNSSNDSINNKKEIIVKKENPITTKITNVPYALNEDDKVKVLLITDEILKHNQHDLGMLFHNETDIDNIIPTLPLITEYDLHNNTETIDSIANIISTNTNTNKNHLHIYTITFSSNSNNKRIIYHAKYIPNLQTQLNTIPSNSISSLKHYLFIYAYEHNEKPLTQYEPSFTKWRFNMSSPNAAHTPQALQHHCKRFIIKLPIIKYDYISRNINLNLGIVHIKTLTACQSELLQDAKSDLFHIKEHFMKCCLSEWDVMIKESAVDSNRLRYLMEIQDKYTEYRTVAFTKENLGLFDNDVVCCVLNVDVNEQWSEKCFVQFNSVKEVIELEYTLIDTLNVKIINESDVKVEEVEVNVNHFNFSPKAVVRQILTVCNCDSITNAHKYRLIAVKKNTNYRIVLAVYNYYNHNNNVVDAFKKIIRNNYMIYELIYKYIP